MYEYSRTYFINKIYFFRFLLNIEQDEKTDQEKETEVNLFFTKWVFTIGSENNSKAFLHFEEQNSIPVTYFRIDIY